MPQFANLHLSNPILQALTEEGYTTPTPIQAQAIPPALEGKDVLGCAQTGTGKTAAFAVPILDRLLKSKPDMAARGQVLPRALILSPTRELATQIADSFRTYGRHTGLSYTVIYGGVSQFHQVRSLQRGVDIVVATPGRLIDLMQQGHVDLSKVSIFVLDEADRMLDMGFIAPIRQIASALPKPKPKNKPGEAHVDGQQGRQTMLFSATMAKEILHLAESLLRDPVRIAVAPVATAAPLIEQSLYFVPKALKPALLLHIMNEQEIERAVIFTKTKHGADRLTMRLHREGIGAEVIHGNKAQNYRQRALNAFRSGKTSVLVATDVAARGLDVDDITHVFNFDLPMEPDAYVHRIGRTGRMGKTGIAVSFCDRDERGLLRDIERLMGKKIPVVEKLPEGLNMHDAESDRDDSRRGGGGGGGRSDFGGGRGNDRGHDRGAERRPPSVMPLGAHAYLHAEDRRGGDRPQPAKSGVPVFGGERSNMPRRGPDGRGVERRKVEGDRPATPPPQRRKPDGDGGYPVRRDDGPRGYGGGGGGGGKPFGAERRLQQRAENAEQKARREERERREGGRSGPPPKRSGGGGGGGGGGPGGPAKEKRRRW